MAAMKGLPTTVAMTKVQRIDALRMTLETLLDRVECTNPSEPNPDLRTYRLIGLVHPAVEEAKRLLSEEDDRAVARAMKDERKAKREAADAAKEVMS